MANLFVYGTLLFPEVIQNITGRLFKSSSAKLAGYKRLGILGCDYPAIIEKENALTQGELLFAVDEESMRKIEAFEGDEYVKRKLTVISDKKEFEAIVFIWASDAKMLTECDWNIAEFNRKYLGNYLK